MSTRETKKLATDATVVGSPPAATSRSSPRTYASATAAWRSREKIRVTLIGRPAAIESSIASRPGTGRGDLDVHVPSIDELRQTLRLLERFLPLGGEIRIDLERDVSVEPLGRPTPAGADRTRA